MGLGRNARPQARPLRRTTTADLNAWLGKESGKPVHVATEDTDLAAELKRGLSFIHDEKQTDKKPSKRVKQQ
jgi:hypothetical protein